MNTIGICQKILSNLIITFSEVMPIFLSVLVVIILLAGLISFFTQILKTKAFLRKNLQKKVSTPPALQSMIDQLKLQGRVDLIEDIRNFSFCYGIIKPRIALSRGLLTAIDKHELKAVLIHENQHLLKYDPLKMIIGQTISSMFFFVPFFKDFQNYYLFSKEIAADQAVIKNVGKHSLISVLSKLMLSDSPKFAGVAALININDLEKRILYLTGKQIKNTFKPSLTNLLLSTFAVLFSLIIVNAPVYALNLHDESICKAEKEIIFSKYLLYTPKDASK